MALVKVSVENMDNSDKKLHEIDMSKSLDENIKNICEIFEKPSPTSAYGLKLISKNDGTNVYNFISQDNFHEIKDGYFLSLVYSVNYYVKRIFDHINDKYKEKSYSDLYELSVDPEFIKELVRCEKHVVLIDHFTNNSELTEQECTACLIAIVHLFQKNYINDISQKFLEKVISMAKLGMDNEALRYALSVIHKILCHRNPNFGKWKEETIRQITINYIITFIKKKDAPDIQYGALLVINAIIRCCKGEKRQQLIREINLKQNRETIFRYIIAMNRVEKNMARELYIYQTNLLSIFAEPLSSTITINDEDLLSPTELEIPDEQMKKMSLLLDFDEAATRNKSASIDNLLDYDDIRISLASMSSKYSEESSRLSNYSRTHTNSETIIDYNNEKISILTVEALRHYKKYHAKNFLQTQIEEKTYEPGILISSERIMQMLAKIMHVGMDPDRTSTCYQPIIFNCSSKIPFFLELFSRTMWLLSKTRREMKAWTLQDYEKVIHVLEKQIKLVLERKPLDFKALTDCMIETSYETVLAKWQEEKTAEMRTIFETYPSVQIIKQRFAEFNKKFVYKQRITYIKQGSPFPKFNDNKKNVGFFFAKLSTNERELIISNYNTSNQTHIYAIANITHLVQGKACPHVINNCVKEPHLAFSIIINNSDYINFKAKDKKMANYWLDALNLLLEKDNRSEHYQSELKELVEMDLQLKFLELQDVQLPKRPPPIPKSPFTVRPVIPPKPLSYPNKK